MKSLKQRIRETIWTELSSWRDAMIARALLEVAHSFDRAADGAIGGWTIEDLIAGLQERAKELLPGIEDREVELDGVEAELRSDD